MKLRKKFNLLLALIMLFLLVDYNIPTYAETRIAEINFAYTGIKDGDSIESTASKFAPSEPDKYVVIEYKVKDHENYNVWTTEGKYINGHIYTIIIKAEPREGYKFISDFNEHSNINVDGYRITGTQGISEDYIYFEYQIKVGSKEIKELNLIFNEPVVGKKPEFVISTYTTVPEGVFKGNMGLYWQVGSDYNMSDAREMKEDDVFEPGKYYTAQLYDGDNFEISQGYFRNNECIKINGVIREDRPFFYTPEDVHDLNIVSAKADSCTEDGNSEYYTCSICGKHYSDETARTEIAGDSWIIKATGHKWDSGKVTKAATTTETGIKTYTCTVCNTTQKEEISRIAVTETYVSMYRLYNPNSGEHFYTASAGERDHLASVGWNYEGVAWNAPKTSNVPVYRLYNPNAGDHHYTTNASERDHLVSVGWNDEGIGWYSTGSDGQALYRLYNPNAITGTHHYTTSAGERDNLVSLGWHDEGIAWYGGK